MTAQEVREEHEKALAALSPAQITAIARLQKAQQLTNFNGRHWRENLLAIFVTEAIDRSDPAAGHA